VVVWPWFSGDVVGSASRSQIRRLPTHKFQDEERFATCAICQSDYTVGEDVKELPCSHTFHPQCVDSWLAIKADCPLCRHQIIAPVEGEA